MTLLETLFTSRPGQLIATKAGLPEPPVLRRGRALPTGPVALADLGGRSLVAGTLALMGVSTVEPVVDGGDDPPPDYPERLGALLVDVTGVTTINALEGLRAVLRPAVRALEPSGRVVLVGTDATALDGWEGRAVAQAFDGINRTIAKELRGGATSNLVRVSAGTRPEDLASTLSFLLAGRSAFVDGQSWLVGPPVAGSSGSPVAGSSGSPAPGDGTLAGRIIVVTGAARGIGAAITRVLAAQGALVVAVDVPASGEALASVTNEVRGTALQLDITVADAGERIAGHIVGRFGPGSKVYAIVHNAGITRDKMLVNTDAARWASVLQVNLAAQIRINHTLLEPDRPGGLADGGRIVGVASTSGIAGNRGQANYAASKAGVVGLVRAMAPDLAARGITVNAVAPGFIETEMTAKIPFVQREIFRRTNSLGQAGLPVDVAETIAWLADPASGGITGQVVRVCGQNLVGA